MPEGVTVSVKSRVVTVKGPRGTLTKSFRHEPVEMEMSADGKQVHLARWMATKKENANLQTFTAHIRNMIIGVTQGFRYKMRLVYAHFPINVNIEAKTLLEIRNFLGEKEVRRVPCVGGTTITKTTTVKDEIVLEGNSIDEVSLTASQIHQSCNVKGRKDLRKFLDGIYVSESGPIPLPQ